MPYYVAEHLTCRKGIIAVMVWSYAATMQVLMRHGLLGKRHGGWYELTPLGQAVRDYLKGQP